MFNLWLYLGQVLTRSLCSYKSVFCFKNLEEVEGPDLLHSSNSCASHTGAKHAGGGRNGLLGKAESVNDGEITVGERDRSKG